MNIALIGLGMVADTHLAAIQHSTKGLVLAGVYGRNPKRAQGLCGPRRRSIGISGDAV